MKVVFTEMYPRMPWELFADPLRCAEHPWGTTVQQCILFYIFLLHCLVVDSFWNSALVVTLRVWDERQYLINTSFLFYSGLIQGFTVRNLVSIQLKSIDVLSVNRRVSKRAYSESKYACTVCRSDVFWYRARYFTSVYIWDVHIARSFLVSSAEYCNQNNRVICLVKYSVT